jgi:hypothetical protein
MKIMLMRECGNVLMCKCVDALMREGVNADCIAQRTIMRRMPSSINEKAQSSIEPKIMGVKISKKIRIYFMTLSIIAQSSKLKAQCSKQKMQSRKLNAKL